MIYKSLDKAAFIREFALCGRADQFSTEALGVLFDYYDGDWDLDYEMDVIAICCDWTEYTKQEILSGYGGDDEDFDNILDRLDHKTLVIRLDSGNYLLRNF